MGVVLLYAGAISAQQSTAEELQRAHDELIATRKAIDVALLRDGADRVTNAGERTRSVGSLLSQVGDRFTRSLGR